MNLSNKYNHFATRRSDKTSQILEEKKSQMLFIISTYGFSSLFTSTNIMNVNNPSTFSQVTQLLVQATNLFLLSEEENSQIL